MGGQHTMVPQQQLEVDVDVVMARQQSLVVEVPQ